MVGKNLPDAVQQVFLREGFSGPLCLPVKRQVYRDHPVALGQRWLERREHPCPLAEPVQSNEQFGPIAKTQDVDAPGRMGDEDRRHMLWIGAIR